ncbi:MAG: hypothetical protein D5R97_05780 [Candidatus Syntrophonatronum acetioxidans]|uniref:Uncharacterized protein n=1 Tax=Candidatus Syntrophonatronum acetioxidans TaxID=1795816 RepID=A0A424YDY6_9FIRM|nr:MAG: hypothetical protein D5R97_05780 [Candidatus Syntrophonatronum acetioxidans]
MIIKVLAAVFAGYECYKMLNAGAFIGLIKRIRSGIEEPEKEKPIKDDPFFQRVFIIEGAYIVFSLGLLFTEYRYFTLALIFLSIILLLMEIITGISKGVFALSSAICALLLMTIILL